VNNAARGKVAEVAALVFAKIGGENGMNALPEGKRCFAHED
jgi:hypothetical protein